MKKILSVLMCIAVIISILPSISLPASAASTLTWSYSNGTLTIDWATQSEYSLIPWQHHKNKIHTVIIGASVLCIPKNAFSDCTALTNVTFKKHEHNGNSVAGSLANIGDYAFSGCTALESIEISGNVSEVGVGAFSGCTSLSEIKLDEVPAAFSLYYMAYTAKSAFENTAFYNDEANWEDGLLYIGDVLIKAKDTVSDATIKEGTRAIAASAFCDNKALTKVTFPDSLRYIGKEAFKGCDGITEITIPSKCVILKGAFSHCNALKKVVIPADVTIYEGAFDYSYSAVIFCDKDSSPHEYAELYGILYKLNSNESPELPLGGVCGENLYWQLTLDGTLTIRGEGEMSFDDNPWDSIKNRIKKVVMEGAANIVPAAFKDFTNLESVIIPKTVKTIGDDAFSGCVALKDVIISTYLAKYEGMEEIGARAFYGCTALEMIAIPACVKTIGERAFENNTALERAIFYGDTSIKDGAFSGCMNLAIIGEHGDSAQAYANINNIKFLKIGYQGFFEDTKTPHDIFWAIDEEGTLVISGRGAMINFDENTTPWRAIKSSIKKIIIAEGITQIGENAFSNCENLEVVEFPAGMIGCALNAFGGTTAVKEVHVDKIEDWCGIFFSYETANPLHNGAKLYINGEFSEDLVIPGNVKEIRFRAFNGYKHMKSLVISEGVEEIESCAFYECDVEKIEIPASLKLIDNYAFTHDTLVRDVYIKDLDAWFTLGRFNFHQGGYNLYLNDELVTEVVFPEGQTYIDSYALNGCKSIKKLVIPEGVTAIRVASFAECTALEEVHIPKTVNQMFDSAFRGCSNIKEVHIEDIDAWCKISFSISGSNPLHAGAGLYLNGDAVTHVTFPEGTKLVRQSHFEGCSSLKSVTLPEGVMYIEEYAFQNCTALETVNLPNTITRIFEDVFDGTAYRNNPENYDEDGLLYNGKYLIAAAPDIENAIIKAGTTFIAGSAFKNCDKLITVTMPNTLLGIDRQAFLNCTALNNVKIPGSVQEIQFAAFENCTSLNDVEFHSKETLVNSWIFSRNKDLIITCYQNSTAHEYAKRNACKYKFFGSDVVHGGSTLAGPMGGGGGGGSSKPKPKVGLTNFKAVNEYTTPFTDVKDDAWYYDSVKTAFELDLVKGAADGKYNPEGNVTIAEAITLAARIHSIYTTGKSEFIQGDVWYQVYVDYAIENGIITDGEYTDVNAPATRAQFAKIFAKAILESDFNVINSIEAGKIPDVAEDESVYLLYNAGILAGSDEAHSFKPDTNIKRSEVATIATRIVDKTKRITFEIK